MRWVTVSSENGVGQISCVVCGAPVVLLEEGVSEETCEHLLYVYLEEVGIFDAVREDISETIEEFESGSYQTADEARRALADGLPAKGFLLEMHEPGRGGGHMASSIIIGFEML